MSSKKRPSRGANRSGDFSLASSRSSPAGVPSASSSVVGTNVMKFSMPIPRHSASSAASADDEPTIFPPTLFTDALYSRGVLIPNPFDTNAEGSAAAATAAAQRDTNANNNTSRFYVGCKVAKDFDGTIYRGTITKYTAATNEDNSEALWHVAYEDGDEEDYNRQELLDAIGLYDQVSITGTSSIDGAGAVVNIDSTVDVCQDVEVEVPADYFCAEDHHNVKARHLPYKYGTRGGRTVPMLSELEATMWTQRHAAHAAAQRRFPMEAVRLLGTITLYFEERSEKGAFDKVGLLAMSRKASKLHRSRQISRFGIPRKPKACYDKFTKDITPKQALTEAMLEMDIEEGASLDFLPDDVRERLEKRSMEIRSSWKPIKNSQPLRECWHPYSGDFVKEALGDNVSDTESHIPIETLASWAKNENGSSGVTVIDRAEGRTASLYNGLRHVQTDAISILDALLDLSHTTSLYEIPLITPVAVARTVKTIGDTSRTWKIRIGVYMNRLLPEVLTASTLHVIMSALDEGSFIVSEALHTPPMRNPADPVFVSAKYPIVRVPGKGEIIEIDIDEDDMSVEEEKKTEDTDRIVDAAMMGASRDSRTISPFTTSGLLKLLESQGNVTTDWSDIAESLRPFLQLDLMLHQQHAVCWMRQMESLGGLGINSILWEERKFLDGGCYYYSPALGQIRLGKPPSTVGGILSDMMGLGKTLEVLCLIASTLEQLKAEAREGGDDCTHATLLILPPALVAQWRKEIEKSCGDTLKVDVLDAHAKFIDEDIVQDQGKGPDILITTYGALEATKTSKFLASWQWGRIVLDEMQEIRSSTTKIAKNCDGLVCTRRWLVSGTPIFEGISDLRGELNFLRLEPYAAKLEDGFFDFSITNHWNTHSEHGLETLKILGLLMLRRSKDMTIASTGRSIMEQKKLTVEFVPVSQEPSERALYCWMEHIVSEELKQKSDGSKDNLKSRDLCLRMLRELCFTPCLLNGGMGVASQLKTLNTLMVRANRRAHSGALHNSNQMSADNDDRPRKRRETIQIMSCDEALRFLTQVRSEANVGDEFVSDVRFGRGGGATNRAHAMDSVEDQIQEAQSDVDVATKEMVEARRKRAKAHWHFALEMITTGVLSNEHEDLGVASKFSSLWRWRRLSIGRAEESGTRATSLPEILVRGWRPKASFQHDLYSLNSTFAWAHPFSLRLDHVPGEVTEDDIKMSVSKAGIDIASIKMDKVSGTSSSQSSPNSWSIWLQLSNKADLNSLVKVASTKTGLELDSSCTIPQVETTIKKATDAYSNAKSENNVYPCPVNKKREVETRKALHRAQQGLRMRFGNSSGSTSPPSLSVTLSHALGPTRSVAPRSSQAMIESCSRNIAQSSYALERNAARLDAGKKTIARLTPALNTGLLSQEVAQLSAFDTLEALKDGEFEKTRCPICLSHFGPSTVPAAAAAAASAASAAASAPSPSADESMVAMTHCSHFFCIDCLEQHVQSKLGASRKAACPNCRRTFCPSSEVIHVDYSKDDSEEQLEMRSRAKRKVREASDMLEVSNGVIDGDLWHSLFLSIDVPVGVSRRAHPVHTALPRDVLAHLRAATGMDLDCHRSVIPQRNEYGLSSKIRALLNDLPKGEHAVVFSTSKEGVAHVSAVLRIKNVPCFSLFVGQDTITSAEAVTAWETMACEANTTGPVLVVQAGAAASGLTLTAASKLFLVEPFSRQEEETQAYARCHRYGQKNNVHVKVYYVPVTVESRLLEWRKRAASKMAGISSGSNATYVFTELFDEEDSDDESSDDGVADMTDEGLSGEGSGEESNEKSTGDTESSEDQRRTKFLLGLVDADGNPIETHDDDEGDDNDGGDNDNDRKVSARRFVLD